MLNKADANGNISVVVITALISSRHGTIHLKQHVPVSQKEYDHGLQYELATKALIKQGYKEPMVHFVGLDLPDWLEDAPIKSIFNNH